MEFELTLLNLVLTTVLFCSLYALLVQSKEDEELHKSHNKLLLDLETSSTRYFREIATLQSVQIKTTHDLSATIKQLKLLETQMETDRKIFAKIQSLLAKKQK
ncbi:MAG TPA: hypothetical protein V6C76_11625 [Drouetiella sp.]